MAKSKTIKNTYVLVMTGILLFSFILLVLSATKETDIFIATPFMFVLFSMFHFYYLHAHSLTDKIKFYDDYFLIVYTILAIVIPSYLLFNNYFKYISLTLMVIWVYAFIVFDKELHEVLEAEKENNNTINSEG